MSKRTNHIWFGRTKSLKIVRPISDEGYDATMLFLVLMVAVVGIYFSSAVVAIVLGLLITITFGTVVWATSDRSLDE